jgi:hypothetical protein
MYDDCEIISNENNEFYDFYKGRDPQNSLVQQAIDDVKKSGLSPEILKKAHIQLYKSGNQQALIDKLGYSKVEGCNLLQTAELIEFPYPSTDGGFEKPLFSRFKPIPTIGLDKKYYHPVGKPSLPYVLPEVWNVRAKTKVSLWITEGEKKALKLLQHNEMAIGLCGVWGFKAGKNSNFHSLEKNLWGEFRQIDWMGRNVYVAFDIDWKNNIQVRYALIELCIKLYSCGAIVSIVEWEGAKGVDDYLAACSDPEKSIAKLKNKKDFITSFRPEYLREIIRAIATIPSYSITDSQMESAIKRISKQCKVGLPELKKDINNKRAEFTTQESQENQDGSENSIRVIKWEGGKLPYAVAEAENALLEQTDEPIYQRSELLVRPIRGKAKDVKGLERSESAFTLVPVDVDYLTHRLSKVAKWVRFDKRSGKDVDINAPHDVGKKMLALVGNWRFNTLIAVIEAPTIRPNGSILEQPGYDSATGLYFEPGNTNFPKIPDNPTKDDAIQALNLFREIFSEFPFEKEAGFSVLVAAILTGLVRRILSSSPLFAFRAPKMASGKSLLADCVAMIATGRTCTTVTYTDDPNEERKRFFSALMASDPVICIDNVEKPYGSDCLCTILTQKTWSDRVLGASRMVTLPTCATWLATGNNLSFVGDMSTRVLPCDLDPNCERPEERSFKLDLREHIPDNRGALVKAGLTIIKAYLVAGKPQQPIRPYGRFEEWSEIVRTPLVWIGLPDPCETRKDIEAADPIRNQLTAVFSEWHRIFRGRMIKAKDLIDEACRQEDDQYVNPNLREAMLDIAGHGENIDHTKFGRWLCKFNKRAEAGFKLVKGGETHGIALWLVSKITH